MGDLIFNQILVIISLFLGLILSVDSISYNQNQSQIKNNQKNHHNFKNPKLTDKNIKEDEIIELNLKNIPRYLDEDVDEFDNDNPKTENQSTNDAWERKAKPLRNIFMGIYKNYKSTYLGNKTSSEYRKSMHSGWTSDTTSELNKKSEMKKYTVTPSSSPSLLLVTDDNETVIENNTENDNTKMELSDSADDNKSEESSTKRTKLKRRKKKKKKNKGSVVKKDEALLYSYDGEYRYNIGPGVNISLDMRKDVVSVNLDEDCLKEILLGRWVDENEGRGKKYEMISKILPLFILPFLIQSAIIPFLVTKLKLLLIKSILVGKLAIFLLIISAIKNNQKVATYEPAPAYWAAEPSRRSEIYNGYRVEGRPTTWVQ